MEEGAGAVAPADRALLRWVAGAWRDDAGATATAGLAWTTGRMVAWKVVATGASAAVAVIAARQLGPAGRGVLALLLTLASVCLLFCSLGIATSGRVYLPRGTDDIVPGDYLGLGATLMVLQGGVCVLLAMTVLPLVHARVSLAEQLTFGLAGATLLGAYLLNNLLNAFGLPSLATAVDAAGSVVQLAAVVAVLLAGGRSVLVYVGTFAFANIAQIGMALGSIRRRGRSIRPIARRASWWLLVRAGLPAVSLEAGQVLSFRLDRYLVAAYMTPTAVGVYSVAATGPEVLRLPALALGQPVLHRVASGAATPDDLRRVRILSALGTLVLVAIAWVAGPTAVRILFGTRYLGAVRPLRILLLAELGITVFNIEGAILAGAGRVRDAALAAVAGLVVMVALDVVVIPSHGLDGAAFATVVAYSAMGMVAHALLRRQSRRAEAPTERPRPSRQSGPGSPRRRG